MISFLDSFLDWQSQSFNVSYILALISVFSISLLVEWLSHARLIKSITSNDVIAGLLQTFMFAIRILLAYLLMLAVMSFDTGILIAAVAGYSVGFLIFASQVSRKFNVENCEDLSDLPPLVCM
ncbi:copper transporter 1-like [Pistacia vera]|uniref:Uncharacterized protein n=1 Tax=Pistacia integerrima TaxID=434235 RepID=A0ACC0XR97_9ROSI|nr:copper transporter 1-like [Pistacia vera]KAJ0021498.1 hypothetical protein Pint_32687 [Pistacia integerrima]